MSPIRNARILLGVVGFFAAVLLAQIGLGQVKNIAVPPAPTKDKDSDKDHPRTDEFGFTISEIATKKIASVKMHLKEEMAAEDWKDIIFALQGLLNNQRDSMVEIPKLDAKGKQIGTNRVSVRREVNRIIGTFSKQGREFYQGEVGPVAADALKQATSTNSFSQLAEISQRYFHTKAGAEATVLLGKYYLDRGRYSAASSTFERFAERHPDEVIAPNVLFMAAFAYKRMALEAAAGGDEAKRKQYEAQAETYWTRLAKDVGNKEVLISGKKVTLAQLEAEYKKPIALTKPLNQSDWALMRGNAANNAQGIGSRPFLEPLWQVSMTPIFSDQEKKDKAPSFDWIEQNLKQVMTAMDARPNIPPIPAFYPIASSGKVIIRNYEGIFCVATRDDPVAGVKAGEMQWMSECDWSLTSMLKDGNKKSTLISWWNPWYFPQNGPFGLFFENGLLGSLSHDGTNVYFVDDLAVPPHPQFMTQQFGFNGQPMTFGPFDSAVKANKLVAINLETGKLRWKAGGTIKNKKIAAVGEEVPETTESILGDAIFLGPPLPLGGKLYVVLEKDRELRLVCLDPNKVDNDKHPEVVWFQPLGSPNVSMPNDTLRRIQGINLAYSDNVLVCPTNAGAVLGVDLLSHSLIWAKSYKAAHALNAGMDQPFGGGRRPFPQPQPNQILNQERWRTSIPIIANGKVIFSAYDATSVICLNLRDGEQLWEVARGADDLYIAGVFENRVMVVSRTSVRFLDLNDKGKQIGNAISIGTPSGIGTASKDIYYLPIKSAPDSKDPEIWSINVMTGQVDAKTRSRKKHQTGNLLFFDGAMFAQNAFNLTCYPQLEIKIAEMQARLKKDDKDPIGLAEMGDLLLDDGKLSSAIATLKKCLDNKPNDDTKAKAREKLYEAITELLQKDFNGGEQYLTEYQELCNVPIPDGEEPYKKQMLLEEELRRKSNMFCLIAKGKEGQGKLVEAFDNYLSFGALAGTRELVPSIDQPGTLTRPDVWALGRINHMLEKATPEQRAPLEKKAQDRWIEVQSKGDLAEIRGFVRVFGTRFPAGNDARLLLADKLIATNSEDEIREAENILLSLKTLDEQVPAARAIEALARLYIRKGLLDDAVALYAELGKNYTNVKIRDGKTGGDFFNELITDKRFLPYLEPLRTSWTNASLKAEVIQNAFNGQPQQQSFTIEPDGDPMPFYNRHRIVMDMNYQFTGMWALRVIDRVTGEEKFKSNPLPQPQYIYNYPQTNNHKFAQIRGHLLILNLNNMVYAYDLADKKKLWEYNLFGKTAPPQAAPVRQDHEPDGVRLYYQDGWTQKVGHVGVIEASYICMITRDGLVAVDPAKGTVLWTKSNVSPRVQLMGDESHVFIFESNQEGVLTSVKAIRAADGVAIDVQDAAPVFNSLKRSKIFGRRVLLMDEQGEKKTLRLYDVLTGKDDWKRELSGNPMLLRSDDRNLSGYVSDKGEVVVFNIKDGKEIFTGKLDTSLLAKQMDKVSEVLLITDRDRFYVMLNRPIQNNFNQNPSVTVGIRTIKVNGVMYAFDRNTGKRLWFTDEQLENQELVMEQFQELPVMIGCHQYALMNGGAFVGTGMKIVALDKKTGKVLVKPREVPPNSQFYALTADPKTSTIEFIRQDYRLKFTPEEKHPTGMLDKAVPVGSRLVVPPLAQGGFGPVQGKVRAVLPAKQ